MKKILLIGLSTFIFSCQNQVSTVSSPSAIPQTIVVSSIPVNNNNPPAPPVDKVNIVKPVDGFKLSSIDFSDGGQYPLKNTCDGSSASPVLSWRNPPAGTTSYAITMHHIPGPGDEHVYMVIYDIPASVNSMPSNEKNIGKWGINTVNEKPEYAPPCSKGPGAKLYTITIYALSQSPDLKGNTKVTKDILINAIKDKTLATSVINVSYSRG